jgi:hypothetical protein
MRELPTKSAIIETNITGLDHKAIHFSTELPIQRINFSLPKLNDKDCRLMSEEITKENTNSYQGHLDNLHILSKIEEWLNNPKLSEAEIKTFFLAKSEFKHCPRSSRTICQAFFGFR